VGGNGLQSEFDQPPDPGSAVSLSDLIGQLRLLKTWAGNPSYETITKKVNLLWRAAKLPESDWTAAKNTVAACFTIGRRRLNDDLVLGIVQALNPDKSYILQWRQALRAVRGEAEASTFVQAQSTLPEDIPEFSGREAELNKLAVLADRYSAGTTVAISAVEGMAGVGKTQLAIRAGHMILASQNIDEVLFVNLRGFHGNPDQPPVDPAAVLDSFLRLLGVSPHEIPYELEQRTRVFREVLRHRRVLIVLDNAFSASQIRPLLPDAPGCVTLITSRRRISEVSGVEHLLLDTFSPDEALEFMRRTIGDDRVRAEPLVANEIAELLGYLPLALRLTATRINASRGWGLADHLERLIERRRDQRLDTALDASLSLSYEDLPTGPRYLLRMLSLHPGVDVDVHAAAALANDDVQSTQRHLDQLTASHLVQQRSQGRYELHDLVRAFAFVRGQDEDRANDRRAALQRLFEHYLQGASIAMGTLYPSDQHRRPTVLATSHSLPPVSETAAARLWLANERVNLLAVGTHPANRHTAASAVTFASVLHRHLITLGFYMDAETLHQRAIVDAEAIADISGEATALTNLGAVYGRIGRYHSAADRLWRAVSICADLDNTDGQARALFNLGTIYQRMGKLDEGTGYFQQALALFRRLGDRFGEAQTLGNLGAGYELAGKYQLSAEHFQMTRQVFYELGDLNSEAHALTNLGVIYWRLGNYREAADHHRQALAVFADMGDRYGEAHALTNLGAVYDRLGRSEAGADFLRRALAQFEDLRDRDGEALALNTLGFVYTSLGQHDSAREYHERALALFRDIGDPLGQSAALNGLAESARIVGDLELAESAYGEAHQLSVKVGGHYEHGRAHAGLGNTYLDLGKPDDARKHWQYALNLFEGLGVPEARTVRDILTSFDQN
jgi:tetratricopeptide (TPR) repeat protein